MPRGGSGSDSDSDTDSGIYDQPNDVPDQNGANNDTNEKHLGNSFKKLNVIFKGVKEKEIRISHLENNLSGCLVIMGCIIVLFCIIK